MHAAGSEIHRLRPCAARSPPASRKRCVPRAGPRLLCASASQGGVWGQVQGLVSTGRAIVHGVPRTGAQNPWGAWDQGWVPGELTPPFAAAHGSLLAFNSGDFHYWLRFLSLFGDSEFPEGRNHDFLSFFPMVLCWRDTQQVVEWMSGWMNEWGSTNGSSSVGSSLIDNKLLDLTWKASTTGLQPT